MALKGYKREGEGPVRGLLASFWGLFGAFGTGMGLSRRIFLKNYNKIV